MKVVFFLCLLASSFALYAQTGFFLVIEKGDCSHVVKSLDQSEQYCITEDPIIDKIEFKPEGILQKEALSQNEYFNLRLTKTGFDKFKLICERLPERRLVLVVNGKAVGIFDHIQPRQIIQIIDTRNSNRLEPILEDLKKMQVK